MVSHWPAYAEDFRDISHFQSRFMDAERAGKMRITHGVAYTWAFLDDVVWDLPHPKHWAECGRHFWIRTSCGTRASALDRLSKPSATT